MGDKVDKKGSGSKKEDQERQRRIRRSEGGSGLKKEKADRSNKGAAHQSSRLALALATLPF